VYDVTDLKMSVDEEKKEMDDYLETGTFKFNFEGTKEEEQLLLNKCLMREITNHPQSLEAWMAYIKA
jgi:hypothetical protein